MAKYLPFTAWVVAVLVLRLAHSASVVPEDAKLKVVLEARYASMQSAQEAHDPKAIASMLAPGFSSIEVDGSVEDAEKMLAGLSQLQNDPNRKSDTTILSVQRIGETATVIQRYTMTTTKSAPNGAASSQSVELIATSTDTWILAQGVWLIQRTATDEIRYALDGKEIVHKQRTAQN
jgi:hypothetical protein